MEQQTIPTNEGLVEAYDKLKDKKLIQYLVEQIAKDHIGDTKGLQVVFFSALSGLLPAQYRFSTAIVGDSSEGKTNAQKVIKKYFPQDIVLDASKITEASLEEKLQTTKIIFFREFNKDGANGQLTDFIKSLVEDGVSSFKMDVNTRFKTIKETQAEKKVGIYTTTDDSSDDELSNRYIVVPIIGDAAKYKAVIDMQRQYYGDWRLQYAHSKRDRGANWLAQAVKALTPVDFVEIPDDVDIYLRSSRARAMRDAPRFMNLVASIAFFHQFQRVILNEVIDGKPIKVLQCTQEDVDIACEIGNEIFESSYNIIENKRNLETYNAIKKLVDTAPNENTGDGSSIIVVDGRVWVSRAVIQKELGLASRVTMGKRLNPLLDAGLIETKEQGKNRVLVTIVGLKPRGS